MQFFSRSDAKKDALILEQQATIAQQQVTIEQLQATVAEQQAIIAELHATIAELRAIISDLEAKLNANSKTSNRPPSSDGLSKGKPKQRSLRQRSGKRPGGQLGHPGTSLTWAEDPDEIVEHTPPPLCDVCAAPLPEAHVVEARQVTDLPPIHHITIEHRVMEAQCSCGKICRGDFPENVNAPLQYGPQIRALAVYLTQHQMLPIQRTCSLLNEIFDVSFSEGSVQAACTQAAALLEPTVDAIAAALRDAKVAHADETGIRIKNSLHWMHTLVTPFLTWIGYDKRRGSEAMIDFGILPYFHGTLGHDGWHAYRHFNCLHSLCNAHHLRELAALIKNQQLPWATAMTELFQEACHAVNESGEGKVSEERYAEYLIRYEAILCQGEAAHPVLPPSGKRGKTKQSDATNLLLRLRKYRDDIWRFAQDPAVPFTNNLAEQAIRMPKVKQKVSGTFRTSEGAKRFCVIRSYVETLRKQGHRLLDALTKVFQGETPQPRLV
jgi:transposase